MISQQDVNLLMIILFHFSPPETSVNADPTALLILQNSFAFLIMKIIEMILFISRLVPGRH